MFEFWNKYGFYTLFVAAIIALVGVYVYNVITGQKGRYTDHSKIIYNLLNTSGKNNVFGISSSDTIEAARKVNGVFESRGETECRRVAERITGKAFPKKRPNFLKNSISESNLEIDCFNDELRIGIEYNGRQHYEFVPRFHRSKEAFYNTKYRDDMKQRLCRENNVALIIVPYTVPLDAIESFLRQRCSQILYVP